jgi:hypothetical protein
MSKIVKELCYFGLNFYLLQLAHYSHTHGQPASALPVVEDARTTHRHASRPTATAHRAHRAVAQPPTPSRHRPARSCPAAASPRAARCRKYEIGRQAPRRPQCLSGCPLKGNSS